MRLLPLLSVLLFAQPAFAQNPPSSPELIARGRHLVENIAMCADCHAQRLPTGEFDPNLYLLGGPLSFKPVADMPWNPIAPPIAGLPGYTDAQAIEFFTTGKRPSGVPLLPPMPSYRFTRPEAEAVVAYLRSLARR